MNIHKPDIDGEMDELERVSQDLSREEGVDISVDTLIKKFKKANEVTLTDKIWDNLENTESNEIVKGDIDKVKKIAKKYNKTNPDILVKSIKNDTYERPLILNFDGRYHLIAGNTRLCTAKAIGVNPKVFIVKINTEGKMNETEILKGGLADKLSLEDIAKKHKIDVNHLKKELEKGLKVEMEHTDKKNKATEIAMDHLFEDPKYYTKLKKMETKESMGADAAGAFDGPAFGGKTILKRDIHKLHNFMESEEVIEAADASSSGSYDVPLFGGTKGRKNPLSIGGPKSIKTSRAVKDKNFPKWGGPGGIFIKIKEKCKKYPYCNQGDINAIELLEIEELNEAIRENSKKTGLPYKELESIVINEIKQIFIDYEI